MAELDFDVQLRHLRVLQENEPSPDEPYLAVLRIKIDGSTVSLSNLDGARASVSLVGGHGSLGSKADDMELGDTVAVPSKVGRWAGRLETIEGIPDSAARDASIIALVVIALEEDATSSNVVNAGLEALRKTVETKLNSALRKAIANLEPVDIDALEDELSESARDAIEEAATDATLEATTFMPIGSLFDIGGILDCDDSVGFAVAGPYSFSDLENSGELGLGIGLMLSNSSKSEGEYRVTGRAFGSLLGSTSSPLEVSAPQVAIAARDRRRLDLFGRGDDQRIYHSTFDGSWSGWFGIGVGTFRRGPAAVAVGESLHVFGVGQDQRIYHAAFRGGAWSGWSPIGDGVFRSAPGATVRGRGEIDLFGRGLDDRIYHARFRGGAWSNWGPVGDGRFTSSPSACSWSRDRLDVVARGFDRRVYHNAWNGSEWFGWAAVGDGTFTSSPSVVTPASGVLEIYARGDDRRLYRSSWFDGWTGWSADVHNTDASFGSAPSAISPRAGRVDLVALGEDRQMHHNVRRDGEWTGWLRHPSDGLFR